MKITVKELSFHIQGNPLIENISLEVGKGRLAGLIGPNGSGKSTLLKTIYRVLSPDAGQVFLDEQDLFRLSHKETARRLAVVSQESGTAFDFAVKDIVLMGRHPHKGLFDSDTRQDVDIVKHALARVGMLEDIGRSFSTLSGGEKQRVLIARALAQEANILILDEPTNHLDIRYQLQIMDLVKRLGLTTFTALHDLNIAAFYCDWIYVMKDGAIAASGTPEDVIRPELLLDVFGVRTQIVQHPVTGRPTITYLPETAD